MKYNPKFAQAFAIAHAIRRCNTPEKKRKAILKWCEVAKRAIG